MAMQSKKEKEMEDDKPRRAAPQRVKPLVINGVRYEVTLRGHLRGFKQPGGVIVAINEKTGEEVWALQVYSVQYDAAEEQDVQDVFITAISISSDKKELVITNERLEKYTVNLASRQITRIDR